MSLKYGKTEINAVIDVLDADHETVEDAAKAVLAAAEEIFEKRAKFTVVGQLKYDREHGHLQPSDPRAVKVALGWYSTEGDATTAASSLWASSSTGNEFNVWVLPTFHGTPSEFHSDQHAKAEEERKAKREEKFKASLAKHQEAMEKRAQENWVFPTCTTCGHESIDHSKAVAGRSPCVKFQCPCEKYEEGK